MTTERNPDDFRALKEYRDLFCRGKQFGGVIIPYFHKLIEIWDYQMKNEGGNMKIVTRKLFDKFIEGITLDFTSAAGEACPSTSET